MADLDGQIETLQDLRDAARLTGNGDQVEALTSAIDTMLAAELARKALAVAAEFTAAFASIERTLSLDPTRLAADLRRSHGLHDLGPSGIGREPHRVARPGE